MSQSPPRILFLCIRMPYPPVDGGSIAMWNMVQGFARAGWEVSVLAVNTPKAYVALSSLPDTARSAASWSAITMETRPNPFDALGNLLFSRKSYHVTRFWHRTYEEALKELLASQDFDVVQIETAIMGVYAPTVRKHKPKALIALRAHNIEHEIWERRMANERNPLKAYYLDVTARRLKTFELGLLTGGNVDVLVPITQRDADQFKKLGWTGKTQVCSSGVVVKPAVTQSPPEPLSVFFLGALDWEPNLEGVWWFLKEVWPGVKSQSPDAKFYLAGRNMPQSLARYRAPGVEVVGEVPDAQVFMEGKGVMIAPVFSGSGMRVKLAEAMAVGKPIVATKLAAEGLAVKHGQHLMMADSPELFRDHLLSLLSRPDIAAFLGEEARKWVATHLSNDTLVGKLADYYLTSRGTWV